MGLEVLKESFLEIICNKRNLMKEDNVKEKEEQRGLLIEIIKGDEELGLYDE